MGSLKPTCFIHTELQKWLNVFMLWAPIQTMAPWKCTPRIRSWWMPLFCEHYHISSSIVMVSKFLVAVKSVSFSLHNHHHCPSSDFVTSYPDGSIAPFVIHLFLPLTPPHSASILETPARVVFSKPQLITWFYCLRLFQHFPSCKLASCCPSNTSHHLKWCSVVLPTHPII